MCGPFPVETVLEMISRGQVGRTSQVSTDGMTWCLAGQREDLYPADRSTDESGHSSEAAVGMPLSTTKQWYVSNDGKTGTGPYSQQEISSLYQKQQFYADSLVWMDGVNPAPLKSSPDFAFLFQAPQGAAGYSTASTIGLQSEPGYGSSGQNAFAQETAAAASPSAGLPDTVIQVLARPIAWVLTVNLFLSLAVVGEVICYILFIRMLIEEEFHSGAVAVTIVGLFVVFAFSVWIVVEHWRYFNSLQAFGKESTAIKLIAVGRRLHSLWRTWSFFMFYLLVASIISLIVAVLVTS